MYCLTVQNKIGDLLTLTQNESVYQIQKIEGLSPPNAQVNLTPIVGLDGAVFNSSKLETREIVLYIKINGNAEKNRVNLYTFFPVKDSVVLYFKNGERDVFIEGVVQSFECDLFAQGQIAQISVLCPYPYFKSVQEIVDDVSNVHSLFTFPFTIDEEGIPISEYIENRETWILNESQTETGLVIKANFSGSVHKLDIRNTLTGEDFTISYNFIDGDVLTINTNKGQKSVTLLRSGTFYNLFSAVQVGSVFLQLHAGANPIAFAADEGASDDNVQILFYRRTEYRGV